MARQVAATIGPCRKTKASNAAPSFDAKYRQAKEFAVAVADGRPGLKQLAKISQGRDRGAGCHEVCFRPPQSFLVSPKNKRGQPSAALQKYG